ncbi:dGTPase [Lachnospiraceae bacterium]|nr:dGTPase [Lachnospiraceae bacterium]
MTIREEIECLEKETLSPAAQLSMNSKGRLRPEEQDDLRPVYQRDRDRIIHCKAFRRLKDKTQVFLTPEGDHYRTRLTHTLEVAQIARTISRSLRLNEDLTEAIALGHDLGHTPFGHAGERALERVCPNGFDHAEQSVRVVDCLEKNGEGLNLTWEVRDGIRNHGMECRPATLEGQVVRLSDKVAYIHHDMDDAVRAGILKNDYVPDSIAKVIGETTGERLDSLVRDVIENSMGKDKIWMSNPVYDAMVSLRRWMFHEVYTNKTAKSQEGKAENLVETLYLYYLNRPDRLPEEYRHLMSEREEKIERVAADFVSSMTDRYAIGLYEELFIPNPWKAK